MKRILQKTLLAIACLLCSIVASAHDFKVDGIYYNIITSSGVVEVTYRSGGYTGSVVIPETVTYNGITYRVTSIGERAFWYCDGLTSITIPNSVTSIGDAAFYGCTGLTSITIHNGVTSIGESAFSGCTGLTSVTIPNSVTSIGDFAFQDCTGLTSVTIPNSVTSIGYSAFYGCTGLTSVTIGNSVTSIGESAFKGCTGLTSIIIPNSVTSIGDKAFSGCTGLTSVTIPESVTYIGYSAFSGCTGLTSVTIPYGVTSIGIYTFSGCSGLTSITIPNSVTSIDDWAFYECTGLTSVTIPNSVTSIGKSAFCECTGLTSITIPNSVTSIGESAFELCTGLTSILVAEGNSVYDSRENCNAIIETATNKLIIGCENTIIPNSVTSIGDEAFYECTGLTSIIIPNSVTSIGDYAFYECNNLRKVINCSSFTLNYLSYDYGFVAYYANLIINAPNGYIEGDYVWYKNEGTKILAAYLGNATELSLPDNYGENYRIGESAFDGCTGLTSITIPNGVTSIGDNAFNGCDRIKDVYAYPTQPPTIYANTFTYYVNDNATLHTIIGCKKDYEEASYWKYFYNIKQDLSAGIEGVKADEAFSVTVVGGTLAITGAADDAVVNIYNTNGALLHHTTVAQASGIALPSGIYLVQVNGVTQKVVL